MAAVVIKFIVEVAFSPGIGYTVTAHAGCASRSRKERYWTKVKIMVEMEMELEARKWHVRLQGELDCAATGQQGVTESAESCMAKEGELQPATAADKI